MNGGCVVVIGGGIIGVTSAWALSRQGWQVEVIESGHLAGGSTGRAAGGIRTQFAQPVNVELSVRSHQRWREIRAELGDDLGWRRTGYLTVARSADEAQALTVSAEIQRAAGAEVSVLNPARLRKRWPSLVVDDLLLGVYTPNDGYADPVLAVNSIAERVRSEGVRIRQRTTASLREDGATLIVEADGEQLRPDRVVVAAGVWTPPLAAAVGMELPIAPRRHQLFTSAPTDLVPDDFPCFLEAGYGHLFVRREGTRLLMGYDAPPDLTQPPATGAQLAAMFEPDESELPLLAERMAQRFVSAEDLEVGGSWAGAVDATQDHVGLLGIDPDHPRIIWAVGFSGHGFMHAPAVADLVPEIADGDAALPAWAAGLSVNRIGSAVHEFLV